MASGTLVEYLPSRRTQYRRPIWLLNEFDAACWPTSLLETDADVGWKSRHEFNPPDPVSPIRMVQCADDSCKSGRINTSYVVKQQRSLESAMKDSPGWIESLFNSGIGLNCFEETHALFRQDWSKSEVLAILSDDANRAQTLRETSLERLQSDDERTVQRALLYLMVVGQPGDVASVERLISHSSEIIKKGAQTCRFELLQKLRRSGGQTDDL